MWEKNLQIFFGRRCSGFPRDCHNLQISAIVCRRGDFQGNARSRRTWRHRDLFLPSVIFSSSIEFVFFLGHSPASSFFFSSCEKLLFRANYFSFEKPQNLRWAGNYEAFMSFMLNHWFRVINSEKSQSPPRNINHQKTPSVDFRTSGKLFQVDSFQAILQILWKILFWKFWKDCL